MMPFRFCGGGGDQVKAIEYGVSAVTVRFCGGLLGAGAVKKTHTSLATQS